MQIDCYGFEATSQWFKRRTLDPYLIKRSEGITYLCFGNQLNRPIAPPCGPPRCGARSRSWTTRTGSSCGVAQVRERRPRHAPRLMKSKRKRHHYETICIFGIENDADI